MKSKLSGSVSAKEARKMIRFLADQKQTLSPFLILMHDYPDPDSLASAFALMHLCNHFGITSRIVYGGVIGRMENRSMVSLLKIPVHRIRPHEFKKYLSVALIDTQPSFSNNCFPKNRKATLVIDQHPSVKKPFADLSIIDPECGATSVIFAQALFQVRMPIPAPLATALAYGILSDTLNLYRAGRPDVIQTFLSLMPLADMRTLAKIQNPDRAKSFFKTLSTGIQNAMTRRGLMISHLKDIENPDLVSLVTDFLLTYQKAERALCTGRYRGKLFVSLRFSNPNVEASEILRDIFTNRGEAGGHDSIAGGSFYVGENAAEEEWAQAEAELVTRLLKRLRVPVKGDFHYPFR